MLEHKEVSEFLVLDVLCKEGFGVVEGGWSVFMQQLVVGYPFGILCDVDIRV